MKKSGVVVAWQPPGQNRFALTTWHMKKAADAAWWFCTGLNLEAVAQAKGKRMALEEWLVESGILAALDVPGSRLQSGTQAQRCLFRELSTKRFPVFEAAGGLSRIVLLPA